MANDNDVPEKGEGNRAADRRYRDATKRFIDSGKVDEAAQEAEAALQTEQEELEAAEKEGRSRMAEEDPQVSKR